MHNINCLALAAVCLLLAGCGGGAGSMTPAAAPAAPTLITSNYHSTAPQTIATENAKPGSSGWTITNGATNHEIEGFASATSVDRGGQIKLFVNTSDPSYTIEIFRM